jgi:hypothetical protein
MDAAQSVLQRLTSSVYRSRLEQISFAPETSRDDLSAATDPPALALGRSRGNAVRTRRFGKPEAGPFREGSLPARLLSWAGGCKGPFGVPDLMKKFRIRRGHASMLLAYVSKGGAVKRVGRGLYEVCPRVGSLHHASARAPNRSSD